MNRFPRTARRWARTTCPLVAAWTLTVVSLVGCVAKQEDAVVLYSAADREYAAPILAAFSRRQEGVELAVQYDVESTKTLGLVTRIESEASRTRCDVFWNNEIMHTLRLEKAGLLQKVRWDIPSNWPPAMRSPQGNWVGFAARARVLLVNKELLPNRDDWPTMVGDLTNPKWAGKCCVAKPLFGTTATHFAVLDTQLGPERAGQFFRDVKRNATVLSGNKQVALAVSAGQMAFGLTDTDDALIEIAAGLPVEIVFPDQAPEHAGALRIPNTLAVLKGAPHPVAAAALVNFLVSEDTEGRLAMGPSGQIPVRPNHPVRSIAQQDRTVRWMNADFSAAADRWEALAKELTEIFQ